MRNSEGVFIHDAVFLQTDQDTGLKCLVDQNGTILSNKEVDALLAQVYQFGLVRGYSIEGQ